MIIGVWEWIELGEKDFENMRDLIGDLLEVKTRAFSVLEDSWTFIFCFNTHILIQQYQFKDSLVSAPASYK
jgi:hypothetical protein